MCIDSQLSLLLTPTTVSSVCLYCNFVASFLCLCVFFISKVETSILEHQQSAYESECEVDIQLSAAKENARDDGEAQVAKLSFMMVGIITDCCYYV